MSKLLSRDEFREGVFKRDNYTCVVPNCNLKAVDAHHIIERRLFTDSSEKGGYFLNNGASVCEYHHQYAAETCALQPHIVRLYSGITETVIPKSFDKNKSYDKWGIEIKRPNRKLIKYLSTPFLPLSPGNEENDINLTDLKPFLNQPIIITIKMDGSNVCISKEGGVTARNGLTANHTSFSLLKERFANEYQDKLVPGIQIFGEWLFAKHSVHYNDNLQLQNYFQIFHVYDQNKEIFLGWNAVEKWANILNITTVPILEKNIYKNEYELTQAIQNHAYKVVQEGHEGIVVRITYPFPYGSFSSYTTTNDKTHWKVAMTAKYVREGHIQTGDNWLKQKIIKNTEIL